MSCPYCEIKEDAKIKTVYSAINPVDGKCNCGAFIDAGQHEVKVNGYTDIYKGALRLIDDVVKQFNEILDYCDVDLKEYDEESAEIVINTSEIIEKLFLPYYGGTTKRNFANAIGVEDTEVTFKLQENEEDEEDE